MKATTDFAQMGIAALLPGVQYVIDQMQTLLDSMKEGLSALQNGTVQPRPRRQPAVERKPGEKGWNKGGWASLSPAERKLEGRRRLKVGRMKSHRKSPVKTKTGETSSRTLKAYWAKMSPEERSKEMLRRLALAKANRGQAA